jgi:antitoxin (DNA-binding transcriptional repressor) of toxin-antitoxin stability system
VSAIVKSRPASVGQFWEIVIARAGKPVARLIPIVSTAESRGGVRFGGIQKRLRIWVEIPFNLGKPSAQFG